MSRQEEVKAEISAYCSDGDTMQIGCLRTLARTLAAEVDELRGKLDDVRMGIGCARGQRSTQYCAEAAHRDAVITKLLAMLKDTADSECYCEDDDCYPIEVCERHEIYARACEIAEGRDNG